MKNKKIENNISRKLQEFQRKHGTSCMNDTNTALAILWGCANKKEQEYIAQQLVQEFASAKLRKSDCVQVMQTYIDSIKENDQKTVCYQAGVICKEEGIDTDALTQEDVQKIFECMSQKGKESYVRLLLDRENTAKEDGMVTGK